MAPNSISSVTEGHIIQHEAEKKNERTRIVWTNVLLFIYLHASAIYGYYLGMISAKRSTTIFALTYGYFGGLGITAGCHRLWAHRSYKARWPLRLFLSFCTVIAGQNDIFEWVRDHRVHHKFTETDADPHNIRRGFFFAHMGWLMCKKHEDVKFKGGSVFLDDVWADPIVRFNRRYYIPLFMVFSLVIPTMLPHFLFGETYWNGFFVAVMARYCSSLHLTWLVNSAAHKFGDKPFDRYIDARDNFLVSLFGLGEGWHNYHHVFPWDYSTSELGYTLNLTKVFIDVMAILGLAYDLKTVSRAAVNDRKIKTGDGTRLNDHGSSSLLKIINHSYFSRHSGTSVEHEKEN